MSLISNECVDGLVPISALVTAQDFLSTMASPACDSDDNGGVETEFEGSYDEDMQRDSTVSVLSVK